MSNVNSAQPNRVKRPSSAWGKGTVVWFTHAKSATGSEVSSSELRSAAARIIARRKG